MCLHFWSGQEGSRILLLFRMPPKRRKVGLSWFVGSFLRFGNWLWLSDVFKKRVLSDSVIQTDITAFVFILITIGLVTF